MGSIPTARLPMPTVTFHILPRTDRPRGEASVPYRGTEVSPVATLPANEDERLAAVDRYKLLDTPPEDAFDRVTSMAARLFDVPISLITLVDQDRIWFKSQVGLDRDHFAREPGFCATAILSTGQLVVPDALSDARAIKNSLVTGDFGLRFYAGVPLRTLDGFNLGTLCVIDHVAHYPTEAQIADLTSLAAVVMDQIELRLEASKAIFHGLLMAREIDHRVMNSLQFVSTMLAIQSRSPVPIDGREQLRAAAGRVSAVARVHRHFYTEGADAVSCVTFLNGLCGELSSILGTTIEVSSDDKILPSSQIQPIGLILNELITNAAKHASAPIMVEFQVHQASQDLIVVDKGPGLPPAFDPTASGGLGMRVVVSLVKQLSGTFSFGPGPGGIGSRFVVSLPLDRFVDAGKFEPASRDEPATRH